MNEQSEQINELAAALAIAQGSITGALKDSANPFFKSKYADLASVWDACRDSLSKNGLAVVQVASTSETGAAVITTTLCHKSGQWIRGSISLMPVKSDPQGMGSALTYARRYALASMVGVAQVDDDANSASGKAGTVVDPRGQDRPAQDDKTVREYVKRFVDAMENPDDMAAAADVFAIHNEVSDKHDLYIAIGDALGTKYKNAIRKFVAMTKQREAA